MNPLLDLLLATSEQIASPKRLHVGILLSGQKVPQWVAGCVEEARALPFIDMECLVLPPLKADHGNLLYRIVLERSRQCSDMTKMVGIEQVATPLTCNECGLLSAESAALIRQRQFDILFVPQPGTLKGSCRGLARYGAWSVALEDRLLQDAGKQFFCQAAKGNESFCIGLTVHTETWEQGFAFMRYRFPAERGMWFIRNARTLEGLGSILGIYLLLVHRNGPAILESCLDRVAICAEAARRPTTSAVARFITEKIVRSVLLTGRDGGPGRWFVAYAFRNCKTLPLPYDTLAFERFKGFSGHEAADPFLASENGRTYVFFEDIPPLKRKGRLAVQELGPERKFPATVIMEASGHLSYPCVFQHAGRWFMIPESAASRSVDLFRAQEFPLRWEKVATLAAGLNLVDTTPFRRDGLWYFFTTAVLAGSWEVNLLFTSEELYGPWRSHPASPFSVDSTASRGAGHIFRDGERWIRVVQDCSRRYGGSIVFNEVLELTPSTFRERTIGRIDPDWQHGLRATHTWNCEGHLEIRDGRE